MPNFGSIVKPNRCGGERRHRGTVGAISYNDAARSACPHGHVAMPARKHFVHLLPKLIDPAAFRGGVAVVIDVLRASTTIIQALAAQAVAVWPVAEVDAARALAAKLRSAGQSVVLGGERGGQAIDGFDLGNSPSEYTFENCRGRDVVLTTTNGTRALLHATQAERILVAGFVNFSAVAAQLSDEIRPIHFLCAGSADEVTLEDTLLAGAFVSALWTKGQVINDSACLAWDTFDSHGLIVQEALRLSAGGRHLTALGFDADIQAAAVVDGQDVVPAWDFNDGKLVVGSLRRVESMWPGPI